MTENRIFTICPTYFHNQNMKGTLLSSPVSC
jgi:hypothetical protein